MAPSESRIFACTTNTRDFWWHFNNLLIVKTEKIQHNQKLRRFNSDWVLIRFMATFDMKGEL